MTRRFIAATAQLGPIARDEPRASAVARMQALLIEAHRRGAELVVFPELALTTFFPRWLIEDEAELDAFYETEMPNADVQPLFDTARELGVGFYLGYAELVIEGGRKRRFNTSIFVDKSGTILGKYRKIHLPGHPEYEDWRPFQHLEKKYFEHGDLGFPVFDAFGGKMGMCLCNDRRWPETFRVLGLRGAELVMLGYNTPVHYPPAPEHDHLQDFHNHLSMQAGAYANGNWVIGTAKAGREEGCDLIAGSCIIAPTGEIVARTQGFGDEIAIAEIDLDRCRELRDNVFNFALHREPEDYAVICAP
ncbi:N-carbamoyl-D-amino-acid hydrolase [Thioclava atlantica]|uniref:N-carbamoyl-D-amino-acid hydrolase n=1 Tax=Thioclava atlantica TaxID=1317124 RepID=A0A085TX20_9RHOB|nr:N-carbamoyl-D-amino-acid hydrolase [Thioclava atlantica]KFE35267.1 N-carbamoyl-D-amino-acid hydrolase [Thioclava atlantica]